MRAGLDVQIDHRSYAEQGIDLEPTKHLGISAEQAKTEIPSTPTEHKEARQKGRSPIHGRWDGRLWVRDAAKEHDEILARNGDRILKQPETALDAWHAHRRRSPGEIWPLWRATWTPRGSVWRWRRWSIRSTRYSSAGPRGHRPLHDEAPHGDRSRDPQGGHQRSSNRITHPVSQENARAPSLSRQMGREQEAAYRYLTQDSGDIAVVQGYAGAGKTYLLGAAKEAWEAQGFRVIGATLAAKAAQGLEAEAGIKSRTIASLLRSLDGAKSADPETGRVLNAKTVLVIDEAGMAGTYDLHRLLGHAEAAGCKVVLTGDVEQLQAVEAGAMMRAIAERRRGRHLRSAPSEGGLAA